MDGLDSHFELEFAQQRLFKVDFATMQEGEDYEEEMIRADRVEVTFWEEANAIASMRLDRKHIVAIDVDHPCEVHPSSTPGHFHLYIKKAMSWEQYSKLLVVLAECGIIEEGYAKVSLSRGFTCLRLPGVKKGNVPDA